jgi:hypothetical protein
MISLLLILTGSTHAAVCTFLNNNNNNCNNNYNNINITTNNILPLSFLCCSCVNMHSCCLIPPCLSSFRALAVLVLALITTPSLTSYSLTSLSLSLHSLIHFFTTQLPWPEKFTSDPSLVLLTSERCTECLNVEEPNLLTLFNALLKWLFTASKS